MPLNDPTITATCDNCGGESSIIVSWGDDQSLVRKLTRLGWRITSETEGETICPDCVEKGK